MAQPYIVNGCSKTAAVHPRLEVRDLKETRPQQWSLFIQAVGNLMKKSPGDPTSWHQIGGIHGMPYKTWSGDPQGHELPHPAKDQWMGYCHHSSVLFPTWHRVVMLLVEQAVSVEAQDIAAKLPHDAEKIEWTEAARELRFPFWDWTRVPGADQGPPEIVKSPTLEIVWPGEAEPKCVSNPLASYWFQKSPKEMGFFPDTVYGEIKQYWQEWLHTARWPKSQEAVVDDYDTMMGAFNNGTGPDFPIVFPDGKNPDGTDRVKVVKVKDGLKSINTLRLLVADLFTYPLTDKEDKMKRNGALWDHFASASAQSNPPDGLGSHVGGLEQPHNTIHLLTGGHGHMAYNEFAAFDPIFFMHHANIDRIYAFWEYIYPDPWLDQGYYNKGDPENHLFYTAVPPDGGTYTQPLGKEKPLNNLTPLTPFRKTEQTYWTSEDVRGNRIGQGTSKLYYTYPPIAHDNRSVSIDTPYHNRAQRLEYQGVLQKHFGLNTKQELDELALLARAPILPLSQTFADAKVPYGYAPIANFRRCFVEVMMPRAAFSGSHRLDLNVTLGPERVALGYVSVLSRLEPERCENCVQLARGGRPISGRIMLPAAVTLSLLDQHEMGAEHKGAMNDAPDPFHGLKHAFGAGIATPGNHPLANAKPSGMTVGVARGISLEREATPKLTLWSATVAHPEDDPNGAIELFDWKSHGTLSPDWIEHRSA